MKLIGRFANTTESHWRKNLDINYYVRVYNLDRENFWEDEKHPTYTVSPPDQKTTVQFLDKWIPSVINTIYKSDWNVGKFSTKYFSRLCSGR